MKVVVLSPLLDLWLLMVARTFASNGHSVNLITNWSKSSADLDHNDLATRFRGYLNCRALPIDEAKVEPCQLLVLGWRPYWKPSLKLYESWIRRADACALVYRRAGGISTPRRICSEFFTVCRHPSLFRVSAYLTEDFDPRSSIFRFWARGSYFGVTPQPAAMCDDTALERLLAHYEPDTKRRFLFTFCGNFLPPDRSRIIEKLEMEFSKTSDLRVITDVSGLEQFDSVNQNCAFWFVTRSESTKRISFSDYVTVLDQSHFAFCLGGYTGTTCRVVEAIYRGCIPVLPLEEGDRYEFHFVDGENCIFVRNDDWTYALNRIMSFNEAKLNHMHRKLWETAQKDFCWSGREQRLISKLISRRTNDNSKKCP